MVDRKDQMIFGNFNAHHPSWFSRTGDDRAVARGKRLMGQSTVRSSLLQTKTCLLTFSPDITLLSVHLLLDMTLSTFTNLGSYNLPITVSLSSYAPPSPQKGHSYTNFHKADWEGFASESDRRFTETPLPTSCSAEDKSSGVFSATPEDTTSPVVMLGITAALSPMLCDPSSLRDISAAPMTP